MRDRWRRAAAHRRTDWLDPCGLWCGSIPAMTRLDPTVLCVRQEECAASHIPDCVAPTDAETGWPPETHSPMDGDAPAETSCLPATPHHSPATVRPLPVPARRDSPTGVQNGG